MGLQSLRHGSTPDASVYYKDGLGDLKRCRSLAGLFDPIHDRRCFNCTQAGSINRPDFLARRATYTGGRDIFPVGINCHMIRIEEYLQEAHYAAIGVLSIAVRKYTCSIDMSLLKLSIEITA